MKYEWKSIDSIWSYNHFVGGRHVVCFENPLGNFSFFSLIAENKKLPKCTICEKFEKENILTNIQRSNVLYIKRKIFI